ncbi:endonuclease SmrB [Psychrosphaera sp. B3R10]|nr:endonuclease SmrB [Psychrosphaera sp. I2R16]MBU2991154.1 endonuclease SmrB [Psychrosphaera sp. B3R10]
MSEKNLNFKDLLNKKDDSPSLPSTFADEMQGVKPFKQDKIHFGKALSKQNRALASNFKEEDRKNIDKDDKLAATRFHFSEEYEPLIDFEQTLSFVKPGQPSYLAKLIRRGEIQPDIVLDLHGHTKESAKRDLADLITTCKTEQLLSACIVHGVGGGVLKRKIPHYLLQHPDVAALHQAPLEWGGQGAIVIIIDLGEDLQFLLKR